MLVLTKEVCLINSKTNKIISKNTEWRKCEKCLSEARKRVHKDLSDTLETDILKESLIGDSTEIRNWVEDSFSQDEYSGQRWKKADTKITLMTASYKLGAVNKEITYTLKKQPKPS